MKLLKRVCMSAYSASFFCITVHARVCMSAYNGIYLFSDQGLRTLLDRIKGQRDHWVRKTHAASKGRDVTADDGAAGSGGGGSADQTLTQYTATSTGGDSELSPRSEIDTLSTGEVTSASEHRSPRASRPAAYAPQPVLPQYHPAPGGLSALSEESTAGVIGKFRCCFQQILILPVNILQIHNARFLCVLL